MRPQDVQKYKAGIEKHPRSDKPMRSPIAQRVSIKFIAPLSLAFIFITALSMVANARALTFKNACEPGKRITIAAVGDILYHKQLLYQAFRKNGNFKDFWSPVAQILKRADLAYGNLEGPAAHGVAAGGRRVRDPGRRLDYRVYGYKLPNVSFNYHPSAVLDLKESGFDVISTANNHTLDRGGPRYRQDDRQFCKSRTSLYRNAQKKR